MNINQKRSNIPLILVILIVGAWCYGYLNLDAKAEDVNKQEIQGLLTDQAPKIVFVHDDWGQRNPFNTDGVPNVRIHQEANKDYQLQGIFVGSDKPSVIINDVVVGVGDVVKDMTVKEIQDGMVILVSQDNREMILTLE